MLRFETSRTGDILPVIDGRALISRFNPSREAERFVRSSIKKTLSSSGTLLIVGDLLGYIAGAARKEYPEVRIISLTLHPELMPAGVSTGERDIFWSPASGPLDSLLGSTIDEETLLHHRFIILEWQPSISAFSDAAAEVLEKVQRRIRVLNGNITTIKGFGPRWIKNSVYNFLYPERFCRLSEARGPFLIAASGPSLEQGGDFIRESKAALISLPSSLCFLKNLGRIPDVIIQTDPGYYASLHLSEAREMEVPVAAPLFTDPCIRRHPGPVLPLSCGEPFEETLWALLGIKPVRIPAMGTVAASAIAFCRALSRDSVTLAGLDLCYDDIHPHVRPHSFDPVFTAASSRTNPLYSYKFRYSRDTDVQQGQSPALKTYSDWFSGLSGEFRNRILRLNPSRIRLPLPSIISGAKQEDWSSEGRLSFIETPVAPFSIRQESLAGLLDEIHRQVSEDADSPLAREFRLKLCPPGIDADPATHTAKEVLKLQQLVASLEAP